MVLLRSESDLPRYHQAALAVAGRGSCLQSETRAFRVEKIGELEDGISATSISGSIYVNLLIRQQSKAEYARPNPSCLVPTLQHVNRD